MHKLWGCMDWPCWLGLRDIPKSELIYGTWKIKGNFFKVLNIQTVILYDKISGEAKNVSFPSLIE